MNLSVDTQRYPVIFNAVMSRELDAKLLKKLDEMAPALVKSFRILDPSGPAGMNLTLNQFIVLSVVSHKSFCEMGELAEIMGTTSGNMTAIVDRLVRSGLLKRERSERDRRVVRVQVTPGGASLAEKVHRATEAGMRRVLRRIPDDKKQAFFDTLSAIVDALAEDKALRVQEGPVRRLFKMTGAPRK